MRRLTVLIVLIALAIPAVARAADTWTYGASEHFEVYTTASAGTARDALKYFESVHTFFAVTFPTQRPELKNRTRLIIFANDRQFAPYRPNESAAAFYQAGAERDYIVMKGFDEAANQIVVHEYVHLFLRHSGGRYPVWLNEGLAEFFSTMTPERGRMVIGGVPPGRGMYLAESPMLPIRRLFSVKHDSPEYNTRSHSGVFYAQSWLLTHMIMVGDDFYRKGQDAFLTLTARGVPAEDAMMQVYSRTPEQVEGDLRRYLNAQLRVYRPAYKEPPAVKYDTRVVEAFEAELVTAHLFANRLEGEGAARAAFTKLEQQRPNDVPLLEARAYFELRRGNREVATSYFERAVEHGSRNISLYRDYMRLDASKSAVLLPKALAIAPDDPDIRIEQAAVLMRERKGSQAVLALRDVLKLLDTDQSFRAYQILANAYMQLNQVDDARMAAAQVARVAETASEAEFANRLLASINTYSEQRAAFDAKNRAATAAADAGARIAGQPGEPVLAPLVTPQVLPGGTQVVTVSGRLRNIVSCTGGQHAILEVLSNGQTLRLYIDDGLKISVRGHTGSTIDLSCRAYDTPIKVGYEPGVDTQRNTIGYVRVLDYAP